ncbi:DUF4365 domain-containing protein [Streptomyces ipomoeae]|uniref:DUF4365 domain-containing protein n=1 Tax=Streptomyces ipomoeae TaxID=103232 RepID=UPI00215BC904|nr:DUF4365 domain-containing protein [Streptomyces ipomoeae]
MEPVLGQVMGVDVTSSTVAGSTALDALFPHSPSTSILAIKRRGGVRVAGGATSWQKEQISRAYVHAIASQGGYTVGDWNVDKDGVDVTLRDRGLMVDIQLKCTESPRTVRGGYSFDLDIETYNKLRSTERSAPGHLVLLVVPPNLELWVTQHQDSVVLACHGYWACLHGREAANSSATTAISLPQEQQLTAKSMRSMFDMARSILLSGSTAVN